ncbi:hypothetical protein [Prevotella sp. AGR2160]|jgi:hypothetical protein|uniref:hypothetical protein n=1 Tax=Prevotella sp. AGR2160 TaxID=1280674 RepID=UPI00048E43FE|nr:hypothetical protein [Prevotella sp. AGR2160]
MWWIIIIGIVVVLVIVLNNKKSESGNHSSYGNTASMENLFNDMYKDLSKSQREALLDLASMFATHIGASSGNMNAVNSIFVPYSHMLGFNKAETMKRWGNLSGFNPKNMVSVLKTIDDKGVMDMALYTCFSLVNINRDPTMVDLVGGIFNQLGYEDEEIISTVKKIQALGTMF